MPIRPRLQISKRMQVREQVLQVLRVQLLAVARHLLAAHTNDVRHALVVGRQAAQRKILVLKHPFESGALLAARRIRLVASGALGIINFAPCRLLRVKAQLSIGLSPLDIARHNRSQSQRQSQRNQKGYETFVWPSPPVVFQSHEPSFVPSPRPSKPLYNDRAKDIPAIWLSRSKESTNPPNA